MLDTIIIGAGPAGCTAALYGMRSGLELLLVDQIGIGGQVALTDRIDNVPGIITINGFDLAQAMHQQLEQLHTPIQYATVTHIECMHPGFRIVTANNTFLSNTVILALGAKEKKLNIPGEEQFLHKGVSYCALCDGMRYQGKTVAMIGGGNTAVHDTMLLAQLGCTVHIIHRRDTLRAEQHLQSRLYTSSVTIHWNSIPLAILGEQQVSALRIQDRNAGDTTDLSCDAVFIAIGRSPNTAWLEMPSILDRDGYIQADQSCRTAIPGLYAIGDVRTKTTRQIVTACGDGATVITSIEHDRA